MPITRKDIEHISRLAQLQLSDHEVEQMMVQLTEILEYMKVLNEVDTDGVEPLIHIYESVNVFRDDRVHKSLDVKEALGNAPDSWKNCFRVPRIIQG